MGVLQKETMKEMDEVAQEMARRDIKPDRSEVFRVPDLADKIDISGVKKDLHVGNELSKNEFYGLPFKKMAPIDHG